MFEELPAELKINGLFCGWRLVPREWKFGTSFDIAELVANKSKQTKVPLSINKGGYARSNDRSTFVDFATAIQSDIAHPNMVGKQMVNGLGLGIFNGFSAVDIDHCIVNGKINDFADNLINTFKSYTEFSPSGTGIRIIFRTDYKLDSSKYYINNAKIGLEIYIEGSTNKFVTLTGNLVNPQFTEIANVDIAPIMDTLMAKPVQVIPENGSGAMIVSGDLDFDDMLKKDSKLNSLWNASATGSGGNESETDLALCDKLAFYCGADKTKINSMFMMSPYYASKDQSHKEKWSVREDYRENTIGKALASLKAVYTPPKRTETHGIANSIKASTSIGDEFDYNDTGNAEMFVSQYSKIIRYNVDNKGWMIWNGRYWQLDYFERVKSMADEMIGRMKNNVDLILTNKEYAKNLKRLMSSQGKEMMIKEAQHLDGIPCLNSDFDADKYMFNFASGVINLNTGKIEKHLPSLMQSHFADVNLSNKKPTEFLKFMDTIFDGDQELINYILRVYALRLAGDTSEQKVWYFVGDGSNGKSVLTQLMSFVFGDYAATANPDLILDKKYQNQRLSEVARLKGKRLVTVSETKMGDQLDEASVKNLSGGESIVARFLFANEFEFTPEFGIIMLSNYEPKIVGNDHGIKRRIKIIRFNTIIPDSKQDLHLLDKLKVEKDEIFSLLVNKYSEYRANGLGEPAVVKEWSEAYFKDNDVVAQWIDENCNVGEQYHSTANSLWLDFKTWYERRGEYFKFSQTLFGRNISKKFDKIRESGRMIYKGISLKGSDY